MQELNQGFAGFAHAPYSFNFAYGNKVSRKKIVLKHTTHAALFTPKKVSIILQSLTSVRR